MGSLLFFNVLMRIYQSVLILTHPYFSAADLTKTKEDMAKFCSVTTVIFEYQFIY